VPWVASFKTIIGLNTKLPTPSAGAEATEARPQAPPRPAQELKTTPQTTQHNRDRTETEPKQNHATNQTRTPEKKTSRAFSTTTAQIAGAWKAAVVPIVSRLDPNTGTYHVDVIEPIADFPGDDDLETATTRINQLIESWVRPDPAQYYWVHRRFKTRPIQGEPKFY
jgi:hypothetical protein